MFKFCNSVVYSEILPSCIKIKAVSVWKTTNFIAYIFHELTNSMDLFWFNAHHSGVGHLFGPQIWIWKDLGPMSFWSHGHSYEGELTLRSRGAKKGARWGSGASALHFAGIPNLVVMGHLFGPQIWIWKDLGLVWSLTFKGSL